MSREACTHSLCRLCGLRGHWRWLIIPKAGHQHWPLAAPCGHGHLAPRAWPGARPHHGPRSLSEDISHRAETPGSPFHLMTTGVSIGWWKKSHNAHHIVTNSVEFDPDIQHLPVFAVTEKFFKSVKSMYHERILYFDRVARFFVSNQHWLYYIVMGLARFNLYVQSFLLVFSLPSGRNKYFELFGLIFFWTWYIYLCSFLPTWSSLFIFVFVAHFLAGILHVQITLSHFSMDTYHGHPNEVFKGSGYALLQLQTTMDIECNPWLDFFHGGLQFQIEHHLFPRLPRHRLRETKSKVQELCRKHNVPYRSKTFYEANLEVIQRLKETATKAKCLSPIIWEGVNAIG